ncbi:AAA family ATPase [Bradyrhizobium sp. 138]|uniref:AAA family ATPase n=1 Tax=Bradyrhizobium sp. 138 TaxID=2782615 RepID=UPI001FFA8F83|nr:AAA family ATPase [Bradyrhizobium sp. 138]MCK1732949.1 AAA family ATPase [Bradyrhizobium sp. 138]
MDAPQKRSKEAFLMARMEAEAEAREPKGSPKVSYERLLRSTKELQKQTFAELKWIVPQILPEGLTLFGGRPKVGKSWTALDIANAVASGGLFMGAECEQGAVLALFLEDNDRRLQRRMTKMLGALKNDWPDITYATQWPRLHDGGIEFMKRWILETKAASRNPRLIIVDILQRVRQPKGRSQESQYEADYEAMVRMQALASEAEISILVLHHQRKMGAEDQMDTLSGTLGLAGGVDGVLILAKEQDGSLSLWGNGRDSENGEFKLAVMFDENMHLQNLGPQIRDAKSEQRIAIMAALADGKRPMSIDAISNAVNGKKLNVKQLIYKLVDAGLVEREATGLYRLPKSQGDLAGI